MEKFGRVIELLNALPWEFWFRYAGQTLLLRLSKNQRKVIVEFASLNFSEVDNYAKKYVQENPETYIIIVPVPSLEQLKAKKRFWSCLINS